MFSRPTTWKRKHSRRIGTAIARTMRYGKLARRPTGNRSEGGRAAVLAIGMAGSLSPQGPPLEESVVSPDRRLYCVDRVPKGCRVAAREATAVHHRLNLVEEGVQLVVGGFRVTAGERCAGGVQLGGQAVLLAIVEGGDLLDGPGDRAQSLLRCQDRDLGGRLVDAAVIVGDCQRDGVVAGRAVRVGDRQHCRATGPELCGARGAVPEVPDGPVQVQRPW